MKLEDNSISPEKLYDAQDFIEKEARANKLWDLFQNMSEEEWCFVASLLVRYTTIMKGDSNEQERA